ncbi:hypothetical protein [Rhizobium herbae]|uniref:Uncharacterized protein n=1 Tax=Rhizobium herbae TaxID=508661 RepID=A0ABS4EIX7_9HYPH|nr:hypothetical protein [Rhizobium herbae]MBP1857882.1 hypothetical protein [Rhizobium herbae]
MTKACMVRAERNGRLHDAFKESSVVAAAGASSAAFRMRSHR